MENFETIKQFFMNVRCSQCNEYFEENSIQLVRKEENNVVVRVGCSYCGKNLGLAILGVDKSEFQRSLTFQEKDNDQMNSEATYSNDPITFEEVAQAHKFFNSLDSDWMKYLPKID